MALTTEERDYVRLIAREAATEAANIVLKEHIQFCPLEQKLAGLVVRGAIGFLVFCGGLGGVAYGFWKAVHKTQ